MRITLLTHFPGRGGSTSVTVQLAEFFEARGHQVSVLVGSDDLKPEIKKYEVVPKKEGEHWRRRLRRYKNSIEATRPDFVYTVSGVDEFDVLRFLQVPRGLHICSLERHRYLDVEEMIRQVGPYVEVLSVHTMDVLEQISPRSIPRVKGLVLPYRPKNEFLDAPSLTDAAVPKNELEVCFVGRLETFQKRTHWLPQIIDECSKAGARFQWHIYGTGPAEASIISAIRANQSASLVHFHGWQDSRSLASRLRHHDIFFLCSLWEGQPIAMLEAMASGLACVVPSISPGINLILATGGGWTYDAINPQAAVSALTTAAKDPALLWKRRVEAQNIARTMFGNETVNRHLRAMEATLSKTAFNGCFLDLDSAPKLQLIPFPNLIQQRLLDLLGRVFRHGKTLANLKFV